MKTLKSELLSINDVAALFNKSIEDTVKILKNANLPIADTENEMNLYSAQIIVQYIIENPDVISKS